MAEAQENFKAEENIMRHARENARNSLNMFFEFLTSKGTRKFLFYSLSTLIKGILAGVMISLGCVAYLSTSSKYLGAALCSIGLFAIFSYGLELYTAKVGYATIQGCRKNIQLIPMLLGNVLGAIVSGAALNLTEISEKLSERASTLCKGILGSNMWSVLILSVFGGILIFIATDCFKNATNNAQKYLGVFLAVMVLVLSNFEHSVADAFYLSMADKWSVLAFAYILVITVGNSVGAVIIPLTHMLVGLVRKSLHKS